MKPVATHHSIPDRLAQRPRDRRGYPIPYIVYRDCKGKPHFTINDEKRRQQVIAERCCSLCGEVMDGLRWLIGGPASALHPQGAYLDPAMHHECAVYALKVCPYLAAPRYAGLIDAKTLDDDAEREAILRIDEQSSIDRPEVFVMVGAVHIDLITEGPMVRYVKPRRPYARLEFWRHGTRLADAQGIALIDPKLIDP